VAGLLVAAPLRLEAALVRSAARGTPVHVTGMGAKRSRAAAKRLGEQPGEGLLVIGFCGGLDESSRPGDVFVADEVWAAGDEGHDEQRIACEGAAQLAMAVAGRGMRVRRGPLVSVARIALGPRRAELHKAGALAVDMESAWLAAGARGRPFGVLRVVLDSPAQELLRPGILIWGPRAAAALRRASAAAVRGWGPGG
jgi:4-hydroxy-3-methylbut-2-enyl diphosphate reductase